jgi:hypothetical protein
MAMLSAWLDTMSISPAIVSALAFGSVGVVSGFASRLSADGYCVTPPGISAAGDCSGWTASVRDSRAG